MTLQSVGLWKIAVWVDVGIMAFVAMDPTVKVALIGFAGVMITNLGALLIFYLGLKKGQAKMQGSIDGKLDTLMETKGQLSHAEGRREGIEAAEVKKENTL